MTKKVVTLGEIGLLLLHVVIKDLCRQTVLMLPMAMEKRMSSGSLQLRFMRRFCLKSSG